MATVQQREAEQERGRQRRPAEPEWFAELGIGDGRPPIEVHAGGCYAAGKRRRPVVRDEARRLLASGVQACSHCQPDTAPGHPRLTRPAGPRQCGALTGPRPPAPPRLAPRVSLRSLPSGTGRP
ncbi:DUF6233 domain-containing protein (plasmid) [Streptomyces sp. Qhu-G9]|uniref:DUF6233 domain-containing protein n=1 Tax=Streptomyces sp. Qhu-G9 TaxID=3452799 RepID=UPI0022AC051D|nr:DUF6233 domain-containing protein [Streptomyces aurantiacus]WAU78574.1 DUF6233 domain-containing protein [Streptomyces aurantiacus]